MKPCELVTFISAVACTLSKKYPKEELSIMAAAFTQLGDTLVTIITADVVKKENNEPDDEESEEN